MLSTREVRRFNLEALKMVLLVTINSIILTALLLLTVYTVLILRIYYQRRPLDILIIDVIILRNIAFERGK